MKLQITEGQPSENLLHIIDMAAHANTHWSESHSLIPEKSWNIIKLIENTIKNTDRLVLPAVNSEYIWVCMSFYPMCALLWWWIHLLWYRKKWDNNRAWVIATFSLFKCPSVHPPLKLIPESLVAAFSHLFFFPLCPSSPLSVNSSLRAQGSLSDSAGPFDLPLTLLCPLSLLLCFQ